MSSILMHGGEYHTFLKSMIRYVALLRGINVGGNKKVSMGDLQAMVMLLSCTNVKTLLNSGNVVFDSLETNEKSLTKKLEETFAKTFGFESKFIVRKLSDIAAMVKNDPFKQVHVTPEHRLYVTFFADPSAGGLTTSLKLPYLSPNKDFHILQKTDREVFWMITLSAKTRTTDAMNFIEKEFSKFSTTRNWNTVKKIAVL